MPERATTRGHSAESFHFQVFYGSENYYNRKTTSDRRSGKQQRRMSVTRTGEQQKAKECNIKRKLQTEKSGT